MSTSSPPPVVLVEGDDPSLVAQAVSALISELVGDAERDLVLEDHRGEQVDLAAVAESCATPPFLTDRRVVVVRDVGRFSAEEVTPLVAYLEDPLPTTTLVLAAGEGQVAARLAGVAKAKGRVHSTKVPPRDVQGWVHSRVRSSPVRLDPEAERLVCESLGQDLGRLGSLLQVLASAYGEGARLGVAEVTPYLGEGGSVAPWELTDAIDAGRTEEALARLHRLLGAGERHPLVVLAILHRHVQNMLRVDSPTVSSEAAAAEALGLPAGRSTFPAKKALTSARRLGSAGVAEALCLVAQAELDLKGASALPAETVLELLVARLSSRARAGRAGARR